MQDDTHPLLASHPPRRNEPIRSAPLQRPKSLLPLKGLSSKAAPKKVRFETLEVPATLPTSSPTEHVHTTHKRSTIRAVKPAGYGFYEGLPSTPGTAAYYKGRAFRKKVASGQAQVPGGQDRSDEDNEDRSGEDCLQQPPETPKSKSLIVVIGRTNVRRAKPQRKVDQRGQRSNRRT